MTVSTGTDIVYGPEYGLALDVYHDPEHGNGAAPRAHIPDHFRMLRPHGADSADQAIARRVHLQYLIPVGAAWRLAHC